MNIEKLRNKQGKIWLNVGGGIYFLDEFVNVDSCFLYFITPFYPAIKPLLKEPARYWLEVYREKRTGHNFVFANCRRPLKFPPNSVEHILISHFLEHLHLEHARGVLRNYCSILKPGGTLHIIVPDLAQRAREYVNQLGEPQAADAFVDWLNFDKQAMPRFTKRALRATGLFDLDHCWLYDQESLRARAREAGFIVLNENNSPSAAFRRDDPCQVNILVQKPVA